MGFGNFSYGICDIIYNKTNLGETKGFVDVEINESVTEKSEIMPYGNTPIDHYDVGLRIDVTVPLAEYTLANLNTAIPGSTLRSDRITAGGIGDDNTIPSYKLILVPTIINNVVDVPMTIYKAAVIKIGKIRWEHDIKIIDVTFTGQIDTSRTAGDQLFRIGGPSS